MRSLTLILLITVSVSCSVGRSSPAGRADQSKVPTDMGLKQDQPSEPGITASMEMLQSADEATREQGKGKLRSLAKASPERRKEIIRELITLFERSDPYLRASSTEHYEAWSLGAELLGELKATEALDTLIECINCNNGIGGLSSDRYPALKALIMIGPDAVPKLSEALRDNQNPARGLAAIALGEIGGDQATTALKDALLSEQDGKILTSIRMALRSK